jgi:hypothetical protein
MVCPCQLLAAAKQIKKKKTKNTKKRWMTVRSVAKSTTRRRGKK